MDSFIQHITIKCGWCISFFIAVKAATLIFISGRVSAIPSA